MKSKGKRGKNKMEDKEEHLIEEDDDDTAYKKFVEEQTMDREIAAMYAISEEIDSFEGEGM